MRHSPDVETSLSAKPSLLSSTSNRKGLADVRRDPRRHHSPRKIRVVDLKQQAAPDFCTKASRMEEASRRYRCNTTRLFAYLLVVGALTLPEAPAPTLPPTAPPIAPALPPIFPEPPTEPVPVVLAPTFPLAAPLAPVLLEPGAALVFAPLVPPCANALAAKTTAAEATVPNSIFLMITPCERREGPTRPKSNGSNERCKTLGQSSRRAPDGSAAFAFCWIAFRPRHVLL